VDLAGILLKTAAYGLLRFALPLFPNASAEFAPIAQWLGVFAIIYGALLSFAQTDIKRLVAYSSVSHMGFVLIAIYSGSQIALQGAVVQMVAHGLSAAALFILCGQLYERLHTRDLRQMGGIWGRMPWLPAISLFFAAAALGLPGTGNFVGEFLILIGSFPSAPWVVVLAATGLVLGSVYALAMIHRAYFGPVQQEAPLPGLKVRELAMVLGLGVLLILLGVYPQPVLDTSAASMHGVQQWMAGALDQLASGR
jgi:NADH-quinone oxidoreductase subunit M